jgi:hypothetical protein
MRILFDHGTPFPLRVFLTGHSVTRTQDMGWDRLSNGALLTAAEQAGFEVLLTTDKNIRYQQNLAGRQMGQPPPEAVRRTGSAVPACRGMAELTGLPPLSLQRRGGHPVSITVLAT